VSARRLPGAMAVRLDHDGVPVEVVVSRHRTEASSLSCGAAPSRPWSYRLDSLSTR
jgi:hypothetical protein